jgi:Late competence development protein ComFB
MTTTPENQEHTYQNVMEILVAKEINRQVNMLPSKVAQYIERVEVATFALNRLPPLYASSKQGKEQQEKRAQTEYREQIKVAVRQGIAAVQRDPLRMSTPLKDDMDSSYEKSIAALQELEDWLKKLKLLTVRQIDWDNLLIAVKGAFYRASRSGIEGYIRNDVKSQFTEWDNSSKRPRS